MTNTGSNGSPESDRASSERTYSKVPLEKYLDLRQRVLGVREIYKPPGVQEQTPEKRKVADNFSTTNGEFNCSIAAFYKPKNESSGTVTLCIQPKYSVDNGEGKFGDREKAFEQLEAILGISDS